MKERLILYLILSLNSFCYWAQNINYYGIFPTIDHSGTLSEKFGYNIYVFDAVKPYNHLLNATTDKARSLYIYWESGLSYEIIRNLTFTASYVFERQNPFTTYYRNENRAFQQITYKILVGKAELKQRLRFDERFIQNRLTGRAPLTHRLRWLSGIKLPFKNEKLYFFAYTEYFFNTTPNAKFVFDENWSAAQMGYKINDCHGFEAGFLYVGWINDSFKNRLNQFYLQLTWVSHINLSKK